MKSPWKNVRLVFIIFNLLSPVSTGDIYDAITGASTCRWSFAFSYFPPHPHGLPAVRSGNALMMRNQKVLLCSMCGDMLDDENKKKREIKENENKKSRLLFNLRLSLVLFLSLSPSLSRSLSLLLLLNYSDLVYARDDIVQAHSQLGRREEKTRLA